MTKQAKAPPQTPKDWPVQLQYLTTPIYTYISPSQRRQLQDQPSTPLSEVPTILKFGPSALVEIRSITDTSHPAYGQHGLFATRPLRPGSFVLPYLGTYHPGSSARHYKSDYDLWLDRDADVAVDAERAGNEARFINDYRGTGKARPNAEFREVWDPRRGERGMGVFVLPTGKKGGQAGGIPKGEEVLVSYGKGFWEMRRETEEKAKEKEKRNQVGEATDQLEKLTLATVNT